MSSSQLKVAYGSPGWLSKWRVTSLSAREGEGNLSQYKFRKGYLEAWWMHKSLSVRPGRRNEDGRGESEHSS